MKKIILNVKTAMRKDEREELEKEYSDKLKAIVVILDARFSEKVIEID